jgi:nicotinamidase/pyrazinamidase
MRAILVIDVQVDFCEGGALPCTGGEAVATRISKYLASEQADYDFVIASRDWHTPGESNSGHFAEPGEEPDYATNWPLHCLAGEQGADYHPNLDSSLIDIHIKKGQGSHGYSLFEGTTNSGESAEELFTRLEITKVDVVGIATDHCVRASALDAQRLGLEVRVISSLTVGVSPSSTEEAIDEMIDAGVKVSAMP